ncbi:hypothetical protein TNCV_2345211 [Trichonephila clavipes]|nr:hypothetical protein TNCV_2345211 [Trichonephila clavipes]
MGAARKSGGLRPSSSASDASQSGGSLSEWERTTDVSADNGAMKEGCDRQYGMKLSLLTSHASVCNTMMVRFESGDTVITTPVATLDQLRQRVEAACSAVPQEHIQSLFESTPRSVAAMISKNGGYSGY